MQNLTQVETRKRRVVFLSVTDWVNVSTIISRSINNNSQKYISDCITIEPHMFKYEPSHQIDLKFTKQMNAVVDIIKKADIIINCEEKQTYSKFCRYIPNFLTLIHGKKQLIYHADVNAVNNRRDNFYNLQLLVPELFHLGIENKRKMVIPGCPIQPPVNIGDIIEKRKNNGKIVITHCCSRAGVVGMKLKGSGTIKTQVDMILAKYPNVIYQDLPFGSRPHHEIIKTKYDTDIYIDQYNNNVGGFGVSSLESLNYGCIVLCSINKLTPEFKRIIDFDNFPIYDISGEPIKIYETLDRLCQLTKDEIAELAYKTVDWVNKNISEKPYIKYFEENILDVV